MAAEHEDAGRFILRAEEVLTAFMELQAAIHRQLELGMKDWEVIADNLGKAGWSWGCVSAVDSMGRTIWIRVRILPFLPSRRQ